MPSGAPEILMSFQRELMLNICDQFMYFGYQTNNNTLSFAKSEGALHMSQVVALQKESENYIRKVEQEKKHYYNIDELWQTAKKEWLEKEKMLKEIHALQSSQKAKLSLNKVKNAKNALDQCILKCNQQQTTNQNLKEEIDLLRKERRSFLKIHHNLEDELVKIQSETVSVLKQIDDEEIYAYRTKEEIALKKKENDLEKDKYVEQFDKLKKEVLEEKKRHEQSTLGQRKEKTINIDTGTILKLRLKKIIANNKEKVRLIDSYQKNMKIIEDAFTMIKESSGILDIEEIMNTFIKSEEQNYSLYNYVDLLSQQIDEHAEQNSNVKQKIQHQEMENLSKKRLLQATPEAERHRKKNEHIINSRQSEISSLRSQIDVIAPQLKNILIELAQTSMCSDPMAHLDYKLSFNLNESSLEKYLQELERYIDLAITKEKIALNQSIMQTTLLLDDIPIKEFRSVQKPNFTDEDIQKYDKNDKLSLLPAEKLSSTELRQIAVQHLRGIKK